MRLVLVFIALAVGFVIWDRLANEGRYTAAVEHSFRLAMADLPSGYGTGITFDGLGKR
ncbi:hypothetical protein [Mesorhizobium sangaii]|uniref:Uncharacterized protein n=1 Tax=Mesorhizobium sangaii TaxID=505389 RepID=A0A841P673_9HYPH|nr:hypothetical protein [Mesorhizobium sangaii]MBB6410824.1 hypothetical protein [Mesorhizobium sangaii]